MKREGGLRGDSFDEQQAKAWGKSIGTIEEAGPDFGKSLVN